MGIFFAMQWNHWDSDVAMLLGGLFFIFCGVMNTLGIRVYGLDWREWRHNYRLSRPLSMITRVALFTLGVIVIGLAAYNVAFGR
jgi:hypothetical protein